MRTSYRLSSLTCVLVCIAALVNQRAGRADEIIVSAAASLTDAFNEIGPIFSHENKGVFVRFNYGASGALEQQIQQGAPADVFASASPKELDMLATDNRIEAPSRINFVMNSLVLIVPPDSHVRKWEDLASASVRHLAMSNPASVPSGRYAQEMLTHLDLWKVVRLKTIYGENVRQTLAYVADGDVEAGIVYGTDAKTEAKRVKVVAVAKPNKDIEPILYTAAVVKGSAQAAIARKFVKFLESKQAHEILARYGFTVAHVPAFR